VGSEHHVTITTKHITPANLTRASHHRKEHPVELSMQDETLEVAAVETTPLDRLTAAAERIEQAVARIIEHQTTTTELNLKLAAAEAELTELRSAPAVVTNGRKTISGTTFGKHATAIDSVEAGALDAALISLSIEQRIAVKAQLMRVGLLG
jgi:hypothetical protein